MSIVFAIQIIPQVFASTVHYYPSIFRWKSYENMWPLTRKRSLRYAVLKRIAVRKPFISRSNGMGCRSNGLSYPFKKHCEPFERLELSLQKKLGAVRTAQAIRSKKIGSRSNGSSYPFQKNWVPFERLELSVQKKLWAVRTAWAIRSKKLGAVRTARAIRSKKVLSRSNCMFVANGWRSVLRQ